MKNTIFAEVVFSHEMNGQKFVKITSLLSKYQMSDCDTSLLNIILTKFISLLIHQYFAWKFLTIRARNSHELLWKKNQEPPKFYNYVHFSVVFRPFLKIYTNDFAETLKNGR